MLHIYMYKAIVHLDIYISEFTVTTNAYYRVLVGSNGFDLLGYILFFLFRLKDFQINDVNHIVAYLLFVVFFRAMTRNFSKCVVVNRYLIISVAV